jgi:hypothetical protein
MIRQVSELHFHRRDHAKPNWWRKNEQLREEMDLPRYDPPRFVDGVYKHQVVNRLEAEYECSVQIVGNDTTYLDDWEVRVDLEPAFSIGRFRTDSGNTLYTMTASAFEEQVELVLEE